VCRLRGWPLDNYMELNHPLQQDILHTMAHYSGLAIKDIHTGTDGCGVPVFYLPLKAMANMYVRLFSEEREEPQQISQAMRRNPEMVGGTHRFDSVFMREMGGKVVCKGGSEGLECSAVVRDAPVAVVLKVEDGNERASWPGLLEMYNQLGLASTEELARLEEFWHPPVRNVAGKVVGRIRPHFTVEQPS
jgi:L-asparaginase II